MAARKKKSDSGKKSATRSTQAETPRAKTKTPAKSAGTPKVAWLYGVALAFFAVVVLPLVSASSRARPPSS